MKRIYLDNAAATAISPKALKSFLDTIMKFHGNPSAIHQEGRAARMILEQARLDIAEVIAARKDEIIFTSGATEANNLAILGVVRDAFSKGIARPHIIVSAIEHPAVLETVRSLAKEKLVRADFLGVDSSGLIDIRELRKLVSSQTVLISIMYANNEIGTIEKVKEIAKEIRHARKENRSVYPFFHTDASQAANYLDINVLRLGVDLMTLSSSKTYGPRGVGVLFAKRGISLAPIMYGGRHEGGRRPGTESPALAAGFATALVEAQKLSPKEGKRVQGLRDLLAERIFKTVSNSSINGNLSQSLPNILNVLFDGVESDALVLYLDAKGIAVSGQSACKSSEDGPSHVIMAIGKKGVETSGSIRFSLGRETTRKDIERVITELSHLVLLLREIQSQSDIV